MGGPSGLLPDGLRDVLHALLDNGKNTTNTCFSKGTCVEALHNCLDFATCGTFDRIPAMAIFEHSFARKLATAALATTLAAASAVAVPATAWGIDVETAQNSLTAAEAHMAQIVADHEQLQGEISTSQEQIDATTQQAMQAQEAMLEGREVVGKMMCQEYTNDSLGEMITLVFSAQSFNDFLRRVDYATAVMTAAADEVEAQKERKATYEGVLDELNTQRDEQQLRLTELDAKKQEAQRVVEEASANLDTAQAEEAARIQALAEQAAKLEQEQAQKQAEAEVSESWDTAEREDTAAAAETAEDTSASSANAGAPDTGSQNAGASNAGSSNVGGSASSGGSVSTDPSAGWQSGVASAYGGSSDASTPNPGTTATGAICDDYSMGVAVPMSWPNYSSYLGRSVEISYNGMTVVATVNDCGYMGGGSRSLDLQPGVFKAFGFSTCQEWGVRTVSYRFL